MSTTRSQIALRSGVQRGTLLVAAAVALCAYGCSAATSGMELETAATLRAQAKEYHERGQFTEADALYRQALGLLDTGPRADRAIVAALQTDLARNCSFNGQFAEAESLAKTALNTREALFGVDHILVAETLTVLASAQAGSQRFDEAVATSERALRIGEGVHGRDSLEYVGFETRAVRVFIRRGDFDRAGELVNHALETAERLSGPESSHTAEALSEALLFQTQIRDNIKASELGLRALAVNEKLRGPDHFLSIPILSNLGLVSLRRRDFDQSEQYFLRALSVLEKTAGAEHYLAISLHNNLGLVYWRKEDRERANAEYLRALELASSYYGPHSPQLTAALGNLGILAKERGDYRAAESHYRRVIDILENSRGSHDNRLIVMVESLGILYRDEKDYARAEPHMLRALDMTERTLGPDHPDVARLLGNIFQLYSASGEQQKAFDALQRMAAIEERALPLQLAIGSERQKLAYFEPFYAALDKTITFHIQFAPADQKAADLAATTLLRRKGRILDAMVDQFSLVRARLGASGQARLDELQRLTADLAKLVLNGRGELPLEEHQRQTEELAARRDQIEAEMSLETVAHFDRSDAVTLQAVKAALPENAALIEYTVYLPLDVTQALESETRLGAPRYAAFVLTPDGDARWKDLGSAEEIDRLVEALRRAMRDPKTSDARRAARLLDGVIMQPLRESGALSRHLLIAPDGELLLLPFAALVAPDGRFLIETQEISYLGSGRDLLSMNIDLPSRGPALIVTDPLFGEPRPEALASDTPSPRTNALRGISTGEDLRSIYFAPLGGTAHEGRAINSLFPDARLMTGSAATEGALREAVGPRLLHVATHGFLLGDRDNGADAGAVIDNPLLRSGLALTGANLPPSDPHDGILTALEASGLDLRGTRLVTLSACDTGAGEVRIGEGVFGLRRAFDMAGAETLVMSLWPVSDNVTRQMMTTYYRGLKEGRGRSESLRRAQLDMMARKDRSHPFYWASFISSGAWTPLPKQ